MIRVRNAIVKGLHEHMDMIAVPQDQIPKKPTYPYLTYKFISPYIEPRGMGNITTTFEPSIDDRFTYDVVERLELQPTMTLSVNAYCSGEIDNHAVAYNAVKKALNFFKHSGYMYLSDNNIVVVDVLPIQDRTILITDSYEIRYGFDVVIRFTDTIDLRYENIEEANVTGEVK